MGANDKVAATWHGDTPPESVSAGANSQRRRPRAEILLTGNPAKALHRIAKATNTTPRNAAINAIYRYEADLLDEGKL